MRWSVVKPDQFVRTMAHWPVSYNRESLCPEIHVQNFKSSLPGEYIKIKVKIDTNPFLKILFQVQPIYIYIYFYIIYIYKIKPYQNLKYRQLNPILQPYKNCPLWKALPLWNKRFYFHSIKIHLFILPVLSFYYFVCIQNLGLGLHIISKVAFFINPKSRFSAI